MTYILTGFLAVIGFIVICISGVLVARVFVDGFSIKNVILSVLGLIILSTIIGGLVYVIKEDYQSQRSECESIGGDLKRVNKGRYFNAATKTLQENYSYICVKEGKSND